MLRSFWLNYLLRVLKSATWLYPLANQLQTITDIDLFTPKLSNTSYIVTWWTSLRTTRSFVTNNMVSGNIDHANHSYWHLSKILHLLLTTRNRPMPSYLTFQRPLIRYPIIRGTTLQWIRSFLSDRTQKVVVEGKSYCTAQSSLACNKVQC